MAEGDCFIWATVLSSAVRFKGLCVDLLHGPLSCSPFCSALRAQSDVGVGDIHPRDVIDPFFAAEGGSFRGVFPLEEFIGGVSWGGHCDDRVDRRIWEYLVFARPP